MRCIRNRFVRFKAKLRRAIRLWLKSLVIEDDSPDLEIWVNGKVVRATAMEVCGPMLHVMLPNGQQQLVSVQSAMVEDRFWLLWKRMGGNRLRWQDGTAYDPKSAGRA